MNKTIISITLLLLSSVADAANWYVRPSGGSGSGTSWTAAWNDFASINWASVSCGDTVWVAGGTYGADLTPVKVCTSGSQLYIRRARTDSTECTGAAGWNAAYANTVHQTGGPIAIYFNGNSSYVTVSGRTTAAGGSNGWWVDFSGYTAGPGISTSDSVTHNITLEYIDLQGPGYITYSADGRGIDLTPISGGPAYDTTFSHMKIWNWESGAYVANTRNTTFEYVDMSDINPVNESTYHPNGIYTVDTDGLIVRYSKFHYGTHHGVGEGIFCEQGGGCSNWQIYGNVFYDLATTGLKAIEITSSINNVKIFNNTFYNVNSSIYFSDGGACAGDSQKRNNLLYNSSGFGTCGTQSNNLEITTPNPFVNLAGKDFHIVSTTGANYPRNAGTNLSAYFTADMYGIAFGADGTWDIGALEYISGGGVGKTPMAPVVIQVK